MYVGVPADPPLGTLAADRPTHIGSRVEFHKQPSNSTLHAYSKGIIRVHQTHCDRFLRAFPGTIRTALLEDTVANTKGKRKKGRTK